MTTSFESGLQKVINFVKKRPDTAFFANEDDPLHAAFPAKAAVHPGPFGAPTLWGAKALLDSLADQERTGRTVAYFHVPFCESRCLYCMFYQNPYSEELGKKYVDYLIKEVQMWSGKAVYDGNPIEAVYFGGGTPTALSSQDLAKMIKAAKSYLPLAPDCEITVEGRIYNFPFEKVEAAIAAGANRISVGVQTFSTEIRRSMQRKDDRDSVIKFLEKMAEYKEAATIIDLIYGFPGQTPEIWLDDVKTASMLDIGGIDCYQLNLFAKSPLMKQIEVGNMPQAPTMAETADMFAKSVEVIGGSGRWQRLSNAHWGRSPLERNVYNHLGRSAGDCLAFGCGAGGQLHGHSYMMDRKVENWFASIEKGEKPVWAMMNPPPNWHLLRTMSNAVEYGPFNLKEIGEIFETPIDDLLSSVTSQWIRAGLLTKEGDVYWPTVAGQFWYVTMAQFLVDALTPKLSSSESADQTMIQKIATPIQNDAKWKLFNGAPK